MTDLTLHDVHWAAAECERQHSGEFSVWWMCNALTIARQLAEGGARPSYQLTIITIGQRVEPQINQDGYRAVGVRVGIHVMPDSGEVPRLIDNLCEHGTDLTAAEWFKEFEEIHPFRDGNGRTGAILYNWLNDTLDKPVTAPDFWNPEHPNYQGSST